MNITNVKRFTGAMWMAVALMALTSCGIEEPLGTVGNTNPPEEETYHATPNPNASPESAAPNETASVTTGESLSVTLYPGALDIAKGRSVQLDAGGNGAAAWTSSDPSVVSVGDEGMVSALSEGEAMITVSAGEESDVCRVTVTDGGMTLAYSEDPGPINGDGQREPSGDGRENYPILVPEDQETLDKAFFEEGEYAWQFIIDDGIDTRLRIPNTGASFTTHYRIVLDAQKGGGGTVMGDYTGTMDMEAAVDEGSFLSAMKSLGLPATSMNMDVQVQTVNVAFTVVPYELDEINTAKYAFAPSGTLPVIPLVQLLAMAISSAGTSTSGSIDLKAEEGYGSGVLTDEAGQISFVMEVRPDGKATLYLPRMLSLCDRNQFEGILVKMKILPIS